MDPGNIRNFKDFLQLYNQITERCFLRCVNNFNSRSLEENEIECVERCQNKFIQFNHRLTTNFVQTQSALMNKRMQELEAQQTEAAQVHNNSMLSDSNTEIEQSNQQQAVLTNS